MTDLVGLHAARGARFVQALQGAVKRVHGARLDPSDASPTSVLFMQLAAPQFVICSSGRGKPELARSAALKNWCDGHKVPLLDTLDAGSVLLELSSNELRLFPSHGGDPQVLRARSQ